MASGSTIDGRLVVEPQADERRAETAERRLALDADVEQAGMKGDRDGKPGEDEIVA